MEAFDDSTGELSGKSRYSRLRTVDVARRSGYSVQQIRRLETEGALPPATRTPNGYRSYTRAHVLSALAYRELAAGVGPVAAKRLMATALRRTEAELLAAWDAAHARLHDERRDLALARRAVADIAAEPMDAPLPSDSMTITQLADALGVRASTLRHWDAEGLVTPDRATTGRTRVYSPALVRDARITQQLRLAGYRVDTLRELLPRLRRTQRWDELSPALDARAANLAARSRALLDAAGPLAALLDDNDAARPATGPVLSVCYRRFLASAPNPKPAEGNTSMQRIRRSTVVLGASALVGTLAIAIPGGYALADDDCTYPAEVLDLEGWKLTLPVGDDEDPTEITQPELATFTDDTHFTPTDDCTGVRFRAPVDGTTTGGSSYPRAELREMTADGSDETEWSTSEGTHTMVVQTTVTHLPADKPEIVVAQIHGGDDDLTVFRLEEDKLYVTRGDDSNFHLVDDSYELGTPIEAKFVASDGEIKAYYNGELAVTQEVDSDTAYFKAGAYTQANCDNSEPCDESNYGEAVITDITVTHD